MIEAIFGIPGLGRYFVQGALNRDYTLVMGVVVFYCGAGGADQLSVALRAAAGAGLSVLCCGHLT